VLSFDLHHALIFRPFQQQPSYIPLQSAAKSAETLTITINDDTLELTDEEQQQKRTVTINQVVDRYTIGIPDVQIPDFYLFSNWMVWFSCDHLINDTI
jgi:hypothetical protein